MNKYIKSTNQIIYLKKNDNKEEEKEEENYKNFCTFEDYINEKYFVRKIDTIHIFSIEQAIFLYKLPHFKEISNIIITYDMLDDEEIQFLFFIGKSIFVVDEGFNDAVYQKIILNPIICGLYNLKEYFVNNYNKFENKIKFQSDIVNDVCHININKIIQYYKNNFTGIETETKKLIKEKFNLVFRYFLIYHLYNLNLESDDDNDIINYYNYFSEIIGTPVSCLPVNDISVSKTLSRDIKYDSLAKTKRFYSSNLRQPLHNDYSHYPVTLSPDWLMLYCLEPSEYGGFTSLITNKTIKTIMKKYEPELFEKIYHKINYLYVEGNIIHSKLLFSENNESSWNYFQIHKEYNDDYTMSIKEQFNSFLKNITEAKISTLSKKWKRGDCIIFNDHFVMHERSSFYGSRHLKDMHIIDKNIKLN